MKRFYETFIVFALVYGVSLCGLTLEEELQSQGYLVIEDFWTEDEVMEAHDQAQLLLNAIPLEQLPTYFRVGADKPISERYFLESTDKIRYFFEPKAMDEQGDLILSPEFAVNKIGHALHELDPVFNRLTNSVKFRALLSDLGYQDPVCVQSMLIFKPPYIGGQVPMHQDSSFLLSGPNTLIGLWVALEDVTIDNGCLWVIPGGHDTPMWERFGRSDGEGQGEREGEKVGFLWRNEPEADPSMMVPVEIKKGSLVVIGAMVPHMSLANESDHSRWAYTFHCVERSSHWDEANWLQRPEGKPFCQLAP